MEIFREKNLERIDSQVEHIVCKDGSLTPPRGLKITPPPEKIKLEIRMKIEIRIKLKLKSRLKYESN